MAWIGYINDAYDSMKRIWREKLCEIEYQKPFLISFESESFYEICESSKPGS